jgi:hypothetical protein
MHINLRNLEAINELPQLKVILNPIQRRKLEVMDRSEKSEIQRNLSNWNTIQM